MEIIRAGGLRIGRFVSAQTGTNMYVAVEDKDALVVDAPAVEEVPARLLALGVESCTVILTHEHVDHTWGLHALQKALRTRVVCQRACAEAVAGANRPDMVAVMLAVQDGRNGTNNAEAFLRRYEAHAYAADVVFGERGVLWWHGERLELFHTPGHSEGSACIRWRSVLFSGDSWLRDVPVITRLPGGSTARYRERTLPFLESAPPQALVLPGHGETFFAGAGK